MFSASSAMDRLSSLTTSLRRMLFQSSCAVSMLPWAYMAALSAPTDVPKTLPARMPSDSSAAMAPIS